MTDGTELQERIAKYHQLDAEFRSVYADRAAVLAEARASSQAYAARVKELEATLARLYDQSEQVLWDEEKDIEGGVVTMTSIVTGEVRTRPLSVDERQVDLDFGSEDAPAGETTGDAIVRKLAGVGRPAAISELEIDGLSQSTVGKVLRGLVAAGKVVAEGEKRGRRYSLPAEPAAEAES